MPIEQAATLFFAGVALGEWLIIRELKKLLTRERPAKKKRRPLA